MITIEWKEGKTSKMMYAPQGSQKFVEAKIVGGKGSMRTMSSSSR